MEGEIIGLLWSSMKRDREHKDRVQTGWGSKTQQGLEASVKRAVADENTKDIKALLDRTLAQSKRMDGDEQSRDSRPPNGDDYSELYNDVVHTLKKVLGNGNE